MPGNKEKVIPPQVKVSFKDDEVELWNMVKAHSCKAGFIKDALKYYRDNHEQSQSAAAAAPPLLSPMSFNGVL